MVNISSRDIWYAVGLAGVFTAGFLLMSALGFLVIRPWQRRREISRRLRQEKMVRLLHADIFLSPLDYKKGPILTFIERFTGKGRIEKLRRRLLRADIYTGPGTFINLVIIMACLGMILGGWWLKSLVWQYVLGALGGFLPFLYLRRKTRLKALAFEAQMPDAMELLARSLRAGHTLAAAVELVSQEIPHPMGSEMRLVHEEQRLGISITEALQQMTERVDSLDLRYFVAAVLIQASAGGNLAEIMENISSLIRARLNLKAKTRALTAQVRYSAGIVTFLPVALFFILHRLNPDYMKIFFSDPWGIKMLVVGGIFLLVGNLVMKKLGDIKV